VKKSVVFRRTMLIYSSENACYEHSNLFTANQNSDAQPPLT